MNALEGARRSPMMVPIDPVNAGQKNQGFNETGSRRVRNQSFLPKEETSHYKTTTTTTTTTPQPTSEDLNLKGRVSLSANSTESKMIGSSLFMEKINPEIIRINFPRTLLIYTDKKGRIPEYVPCAKKTGGCAVGTIYRKTVQSEEQALVQSEEKGSLWIGKIGQPGDALKDEKLTYRTRIKRETDIDAMREKIASDGYELIGNTAFHVPRTALSELMVVNDFMQNQIPFSMFDIINNPAFTTTLRIMSRFVDGYMNFQQAKTRDSDGKIISFVEFLQIKHRPPTHLVTPEGEEVPLFGVIEMIAAGRILGDTDVLGGRCDNGGFVWVKEEEKIVRAETFKIDPGCAFNFFHDEMDSDASSNWIINTHKQLGNGRMLKSLKDLQVAQNYYAVTVFWDELLPEQKEIFLSILSYAILYLEEEKNLEFLFLRDGKFALENRTEFPKEMAHKYIAKMKEWILFQQEIYRDELSIYHNDLATLPEKKCSDSLLSFDQCFLACQTGDLAQVQNLIELNRGDLKRTNEKGETLAFAAVLEGYLSILQLLCVQDSSLMTKVRNDGWTLLHLAADKEKTDIVNWLIQKEPSLAISKASGLNFIELAIFSERMPVVELFLDKIRSDINLIKQIARRSCTKVLTLLLDAGLPADTVVENDQTLLHLAAESGEVNNCELLLQRKASVDALDISKKTPLYLATTQGNIDVVKLLLRYNANPTIRGVEEDTLLHIAAFYCHAHLLKTFLNIPSMLALLHSRDVDGKEPIHKAVWGQESPDVVKVLLENGANPNAVNAWGYTPLHWAAKHGHPKSGQLLLDKGASVDMANVNHELPFDLPLRFDQKDFFHCFLNTQTKLTISALQETEQFLINRLIQAKRALLVEEQVFHLLKISNCFIEKENYLEAANLTNRALLLVEELKYPMYRSYLIARLEQIEIRLLKKLQIKPRINTLGRHRDQLAQIRMEQKKALEQGERVEKVLSSFSKEVRRIVQSLVEQTEALLGPSPVKWCCIGLGALGRREITPYSSIELAFLIEKESLEATAYFQMFQKILEQKFMNLGESSHCLPKEGSDHNLGLSLARVPLVGTHAQFALFQTAENEDILSAELFHTVCNVAGDKELGRKYLIVKVKTQQSYKSWSFTKNEEEVGIKVIKHYLSLFTPLSTRNFDLNKDFYHFFQGALNGLAIFFHLPGNNTFGWIDALKNKKIVTEEGAFQLKEALSLIYSLKAKMELFYKGHKEGVCCSVKKQNPLLFSLNEEEMQNVMEICKVVFPFHEALLQFCQKKDKKHLLVKFYNGGCSHQRNILNKLG